MTTISSGSAGPATGAVPVVPSNTGTALTGCRGIYVGTAGDITGVTADGAPVTFVGVPGGSILPVGFQRVNATGTTAAAMLALF